MALRDGVCVKGVCVTMSPAFVAVESMAAAALAIIDRFAKTGGSDQCRKARRRKLCGLAGGARLKSNVFTAQPRANAKKCVFDTTQEG